jgi:opacity protein-like surface antigen
MTNSKLVVAAIAALGLFTANKASAQDDPCAGGGEEMGGEGEGEGNPCAGGTEESGGDGMAATTAAGEEMAAEGLPGYPQAVIDRPGVLPKGVLEVTADLPITYIKILDTSATGVGLGIGARYGLAPKIDAQLTYSFSLKDFEIKGPLGVVAQYEITTSDKLRVAARVSTGLDFNGIDLTDGSSKVEFAGVGVGLNLQYKITPKIAVFTNGDHLSLGGSDFPKPVSLNLPIGFGFQANEKINVFAQTSIGTIGLSPSGNVLISDITPFQLGGTFSPDNKLDIGAALTFLDLQHAGDALAVTLHAAFRM